MLTVAAEASAALFNGKVKERQTDNSKLTYSIHLPHSSFYGLTNLAGLGEDQRHMALKKLPVPLCNRNLTWMEYDLLNSIKNRDRETKQV